MQGKVKRLSQNDHGVYGFITAEDDNEYYFDSRSLVYGLDISKIKKDEIFDFETFLNKKTNRTYVKNMNRPVPVQEKKKSKITTTSSTGGLLCPYKGLLLAEPLKGALNHIIALHAPQPVNGAKTL